MRLSATSKGCARRVCQSETSIAAIERPSPVPYAGLFDGFHTTPASVSKTCVVRFDKKYAVEAGAVGRPVEVRAYADRTEIRQDGRVVADHPRSFGRGKAVFYPWHYVPVRARKPGALQNGAPFKDWVLPAGPDRVRRKRAGVDDGDRQMVAILASVLSDGLPAVEAAMGRPLPSLRAWISVVRPPRIGQPPDSAPLFLRPAAERCALTWELSARSCRGVRFSPAIAA